MRRGILFLAAFLLLGFVFLSGNYSKAQDSDALESLRRFSQVLDIVEESYVEDISRAELIEDSIKGMLEQLDPHSAYLDEEAYEEMQNTTAGKFSGIGIEISMEKSRLIVVSPLEDTPAYRAGLKAGDSIIEIDGESTQGYTLLDAVKKIRGEEGTSVRLTIVHKQENNPIEVSIVRGIIPLVAVKTKVLDTGILYVRLTRFNEHTTEELHQKISQYVAMHELKGIVLDLRNNPGGLLKQAVSVSDAFLEDGLIVYMQGRNAAKRHDFIAKKEPTDISVPVVTLINAGSASASEIVAGALQDRKRSLIIGERSFGKGSVQHVIPLAEGKALKLTSALYYTPSGRSIQAEGIEPDLCVPFIPVKNEETEDLVRLTIREQNLSSHFENPNGTEEIQEEKIDEKTKTLLAKDNQLRMALELVKKLPVITQIH